MDYIALYWVRSKAGVYHTPVTSLRYVVFSLEDDGLESVLSTWTSGVRGNAHTVVAYLDTSWSASHVPIYLVIYICCLLYICSIYSEYILVYILSISCLYL